MIWRPRQTGFTLVELIVATLIGTILIAVAVPSLLVTIKDNRLVTLNNEVISDLALARSSAVTRGNHATLCASNLAGTQCLPNATTWKNGWIVFDDPDNRGVIDAGETIITLNNNVSDQVQIISDNTWVSYDDEGFAFESAIQFAFCDSRGDSAKHGLIVSGSGRSRSTKADEVEISCL